MITEYPLDFSSRGFGLDKEDSHRIQLSNWFKRDMNCRFLEQSVLFDVGRRLNGLGFSEEDIVGLILGLVKIERDAILLIWLCFMPNLKNLELLAEQWNFGYLRQIASTVKATDVLSGLLRSRLFTNLVCVTLDGATNDFTEIDTINLLCFFARIPSVRLLHGSYLAGTQ